jgi:dipeptidyl aminopeptidase/acylaminoacyl peptidase
MMSDLIMAYITLFIFSVSQISNGLRLARTSRILIVFVAFTLLSRPSYSQELKPVPIKEILDAKKFPTSTGIQMSPDTVWVAYTLEDNRPRELSLRDTTDANIILQEHTGVPKSVIGADVWLTNLRTRRSKSLTRAWGGSSWQPVWSPDGRKLAFYSDRGGKVGLWVWDRATAFSRRVSNLPVRVNDSSEAPQWSRDSTKLLTMTELVNRPLKRIQSLSTATNDPLGSTKQKKSAATVVIYSGGSPFSTPYESDLGSEEWRRNLTIVDVQTGKIDRLVVGFQPMGYRWSPDGTKIAFMSRVEPKGQENGIEWLADLVMVDLSDRLPHMLAHAIKTFSGGNFSWSPDNKWIAYTTSYFENNGGLAGKCFVVAAAGGEPRDLAPSSQPDFMSNSAVPLWDARAQNVYLLSLSAQSTLYEGLWRLPIHGLGAAELSKLPGVFLTGIIASAETGRFWSPDGGRSIIVTTRERKTLRDGFCAVDLATGVATKLFDENKSYGIDGPTANVAADGQSAIFKSQDVMHAEDIWMLNAKDLQDPVQVTNVNPQFGRYTMGRSLLIAWTGLDGQDLHGALLLPSGYEEGKRYPLIVYTYPGQFKSVFLNVFGMVDMYTDNMQLFATRGVAVLYPDAPVKVGTSMEDVSKTVIPGIDKVIELGIADPDRLGLMGHSWGGYAVLSLLVQTNRFRAAVSRSGVGGDLIRFYTSMFRDGSSPGITETEISKTGGSLWQKRDVFIENSPLFFLDRVHTPLLLTHGTGDRVSSALSDEVFVCLRRLGKQVEYAKYESEDHYESDWSYANQIDFLNRVISWFDDKLQSASISH